MICVMMQLLPKVLNENLLLRRRDHMRAKLILRAEINCLVARCIIMALCLEGRSIQKPSRIVKIAMLQPFNKSKLRLKKVADQLISRLDLMML